MQNNAKHFKNIEITQKHLKTCEQSKHSEPKHSILKTNQKQKKTRDIVIAFARRLYFVGEKHTIQQQPFKLLRYAKLDYLVAGNPFSLVVAM